jgi:hypothetical protein
MGCMTGRSRFDPRQRQKDSSCNLCVQTCAGVHPASYTMGPGGPFPGAKVQLGCDADHSPPSRAEVKNEYELYLLSIQVPSWGVVEHLSLFLGNEENYNRLYDLHTSHSIIK